MLEIIKSMYTSVKLCIKHQSSLSDFFENNAGVKQGEPLSPFLFLMYINDLFECLKNDQEINIDELSIILLLFADDLVLIAKSAKDMQMLLNKMHSYCTEWKLNVNINKTKVMIFSKKKGNCNVEFKYGNNVLEVVESYTYLGLNLSCNGKLKLAIETLSNQATRAIFGIKKLYNYNNLDVYSKLKLFESIVVPILCYGCEVWGFDNVNDKEKIQIRFYKNILGLNRNTSNIYLYLENFVDTL